MPRTLFSCKPTFLVFVKLETRLIARYLSYLFIHNLSRVTYLNTGLVFKGLSNYPSKHFPRLLFCETAAFKASSNKTSRKIFETSRTGETYNQQFSFPLKLIPRVQLFVNRCFQCQRFALCKTFAFVLSLLFSSLSIARRGASAKACALQITTLKLRKDIYSKEQTKKQTPKSEKTKNTDRCSRPINSTIRGFFSEKISPTLAGPTSFHLLTVRHVILRHVPGKHLAVREIPLLFRYRECSRISQFTTDIDECLYVGMCDDNILYFLYIYDHPCCHNCVSNFVNGRSTLGHCVAVIFQSDVINTWN